MDQVNSISMVLLWIIFMSELDLETKNIQILIYVIHQADLTPEFRKKINFNRMPTSVIGNR
jgi:hypothetical protein